MLRVFIFIALLLYSALLSTICSSKNHQTMICNDTANRINNARLCIVVFESISIRLSPNLQNTIILIFFHLCSIISALSDLSFFYRQKPNFCQTFISFFGESLKNHQTVCYITFQLNRLMFSFENPVSVM